MDPCHDPVMVARRDVSEQVDFALRRHFSAVFTHEQRALLVRAIVEWDAAHPDLGRSERTNGWLAIAYQARSSLPVCTPVERIAGIR
jgi:hypothetical protein